MRVVLAAPRLAGLLVTGDSSRSWFLPVMLFAPAALTGIAALAGLLSAGTAAPCGKFCSEASPDASTEAWIVAFAYVGVVALLCFARCVGASPAASSSTPKYRVSLAMLAAASLTLAAMTPGSWIPLRPALIVGGLSCMAFLIIGGRLATVWQSPQQHRPE